MLTVNIHPSRAQDPLTLELDDVVPGAGAERGEQPPEGRVHPDGERLMPWPDSSIPSMSTSPGTGMSPGDDRVASVHP